MPEGLRVPRIVPADAAEAEAFASDAVARGHEGVLVKALAAPYEAGRRGAGWLKVKPAHTLDLVDARRPSGATAGARASSRTSTSARATPRAAGS